MFHLPRFALALGLITLVGVCLNTAGRAQNEDELSARPRITGIRHWSSSDATRIAIESTGEFRFKSDRLHNPERIFFDLIGAKPQLSSANSRGTNVIGVGDRFIRQIRVAETQRGVTRVVLDLESNVEFSTSQLANPDRLIIEVHSILTDMRRPTDRDRMIPADFGMPSPRYTPRMARLDFSGVAERREAARRALSPVLPEPPSPFDYSLRFATRAFNKPDPLAETGWAYRVQPLPRPERGTKVAKYVAPPAPARVASEEIALPAKRTPQSDTMIRVLGLKLGRVVIDPGHGGHDSGTTGPDGLREKDVVLDVAKRLGSLIQDRLGSEVVFTRTDDTFIPLSRRTAIANEIKADLFLSIHVNSSPVRAVSGVETYYLSLTGSKSALETAMRENAGSDKNIFELQDLLKKIALKDKVDESKEFAGRIQTSLVSLSPKAARSTKDRGVKRAPFVVLIGASMPSVLAEVGFISNSQDEGQMRRADHRQKIADALYRGLSAYANSLSHFQVAQQQSSRLAKASEAEPRD